VIGGLFHKPNSLKAEVVALKAENASLKNECQSLRDENQVLTQQDVAADRHLLLQLQLQLSSNPRHY